MRKIKNDKCKHKGKKIVIIKFIKFINRKNFLLKLIAYKMNEKCSKVFFKVLFLKKKVKERQKKRVCNFECIGSIKSIKSIKGIKIEYIDILKY